MDVGSDAKTYLKSIEECAMINGIKGSAEVGDMRIVDCPLSMALKQ